MINVLNSFSKVSVVTQQPMQVSSVVPTGLENQHFTTQSTGFNILVDEDYRLGKGILDDFRPNAYKTQIGVVGNTTTNVVTSSALPNVSVPFASTPGVSVTSQKMVLMHLKISFNYLIFNENFYLLKI